LGGQPGDVAVRRPRRLQREPDELAAPLDRGPVVELVHRRAADHARDYSYNRDDARSTAGRDSTVLVAGCGGGAGRSDAGSGGGAGGSDAGPGATRSYTTTFPLTENPISEGGNWIDGQTDGLDWHDMSTTPGLAIGHQSGSSYTDGTALLTGSWGPTQTAEAVVHASSPQDDCYQEVEL